MNKTKYRAVNDGYDNWLEYAYEFKILWLFKFTIWSRVWKPYNDRIYGRNRVISDWYLFVSSYDTDFEEFTKQWPDVKVYFAHARGVQDLLELESKRYWEELEKKRVVKYL